MKLRRPLISALLTLLLSCGTAYAQETVRAEVGKPLQAAQALLKTNKFSQALAEISKADAVSGKTAFESLTIERMRFIAANGAGDAGLAARSLDALIKSGKLGAAEQQRFIQAVAVAHYRAKNYDQAASWTQRYFKEGGSDAQMRTLLAQAHYLNNNFEQAAKVILNDVERQEKSGAKPNQDSLEMLATCYLRTNDMGGYVTALEKLASHYPKKEYWADLLARIQKKPGFADRLSLDVYRLRLATDNVGGTGDYMEMAQLALQQGFPAEARKIVDEGYDKKLLGTGPANETDRHQRLRNLVLKQLAEDQKSITRDEAQARSSKNGTALINVGFNYVLHGQADKGLAMMEEGLAKGGLKHTEEERLHLGYAYMLAGQKDKARSTLKAVSSTDGSEDLARLWLLHLK